MKKQVLLTVTAMLLGASAANANGVSLAWSACPATPNAVKTITFDCDPGGGNVYELFGTFSLTAPAANIVAMDGIIDLRFEGSPNVPPFWQFQGGGCNESGVALTDSRPSDVARGCSTYNNTLCGTGGTACDAFLTAYGLDWKGPGTARQLFSLARASSSPTTLLPEPTKYYAFTLTYAMDNAVMCAGCTTPTSIVWNMAILHALAPQPATLISSTDSQSDPCVNVNGGTAGGCAATPTRRSTWGSLKSMYR